MVDYVRCPSCARIIAWNREEYDTEYDTIKTDPKLTKKQKEKRHAEILDKYGYRKLCCRIRIMGRIPYHKIIIS